MVKSGGGVEKFAYSLGERGVNIKQEGKYSVAEKLGNDSEQRR